ncbi:hypothetical protein INR79_07085 [Vibrio sp. SCSIO 43132]|uniref:hypothetical protein n=1 Tax=Vibrio sp. SCSIO 43132 TaxID=2779363 RepID=UPI001CA92A10|nr:hypothetical protein [Vibrio sp. SCSIO 43132]UAB71654.1 hypothetical protein INR79_07085 [Vibrio sp. SCSIO 43132]
MFNPKELRIIAICLKERLEKEQLQLARMDEDTDEYMEKANDLMLIDSLIAKFEGKA